ncbi:MAG: protease modulator HflC [Verrucomicrobiota bacterium]|nr:protease modulator HflC [Verrucomicrobiota bacterium]
MDTETTDKKRNSILWVTGLIFLLFFIFMTCSYQVRTTEIAITTIFGKTTETIAKPGFHWKIPWPIEKIYKYDARIQIFEGRFEETYTQDSRNLILSMFAGWKIIDPVLFLERVGSIKEAGRILEGLIRSAKNAVLSQHPVSHLISTDKKEVRFALIEDEIIKQVAKTTETQYGIAVETLGIKRIGLPESISGNVFERMRKERERIASRYRAEGERKAAEIIAKADKEKNKIISDAESKAKSIRGQGDSKAAEHYAIFKKDTEFALFLRKLEALESTLKTKSTIILDRDTPPYNLLKERQNEK